MAGLRFGLPGLPGCGKSTVAGLVASGLAQRGIQAKVWAMDDRRKVYHPNPTYTDAERGEAYELFVHEAANLVRAGRNVILDATAPQLQVRRNARKAVVEEGGRFAEVFLRCPLEVAMERESLRPQGKVRARLYAQALERQRTGREFPGLGQVPGVDVPYEEDPDAELVLDAVALKPDEMAGEILAFLEDLE